MSYLSSSKAGRRRGAVAAQAAVCFTALLGVAALTLDGGLLLVQRRFAQATADAAALAAATELFRNRASIHGPSNWDPGNAGRNSALAIAAANGYTNDGTTNTVVVNIPPSSGNFTDPTKYPGYAEVIVTYNQPRLFSGLFGSGTLTIQGRAVAREVVAPVNVSILTLAPTGTSLLVSGNTSITVPGPVVVDSSSSTAFSINGNSSSITASMISMVGNFSNSGNAGVSPAPTTGATPVADPLASLAPPDPTSIPGGVQSSSPMTIKGGTATLNPGVYQGGISVTNGAQVTLNPGIYYIEGGGLSLQNPGTTVTGAGVLIYNGETNGATNNPSSVGPITLQAHAVLNISPISTGTWAGISIFQDRSATAPISLQGGAGTNITGMVYAPLSNVTIIGGSNVIEGTSFITNTLNVQGGSSFSIPNPAVPVPISSNVPGVQLVE
jgi:hypothetical protein